MHCVWLKVDPDPVRLDGPVVAGSDNIGHRRDTKPSSKLAEIAAMMSIAEFKSKQEHPPARVNPVYQFVDTLGRHRRPPGATHDQA